MRDPKRIPEILDRIKTQWEKFPDMRLGQLILNAINNPTTLYYVEDDKLADCIDLLYGSIKVKGEENDEGNDN